MAHDHSHGNSTQHGKAFAIAIALNAGFVVLEFCYGFLANSTSLMADAGHNLSDVLGLLLAWGAAILVRKTPSGRYTYGLRSSSILAALANAVLLLIACGAMALEAVQRFSEPVPVSSVTVVVVAMIGIAINGLSAWLFLKGSKGDLNIRGAYLHMAADAGVTLGVVIAGLVMMWTGWSWLDPAASLVITAMIVATTWGLLRESVQLALNAVPAHINLPEVSSFLLSCPGVTDVHDLHIWAMSTTESALTAHLVVPDQHPDDRFLEKITSSLRERFSIQHCTIQVERQAFGHNCALNRDDASEDEHHKIHEHHSHPH